MIGKTISHYKILERIGSGGMGVVYKAQDTKLDRPVALKFLPPAFSTDPVTKERFINEAKSASALQHSNICTIHEINESEDGQMYIAMDYYEGETLKQKLESGKIDIDKAIDYTIQIAKGLQKAHEKGIIHRDIKPANIMITTDSEVKILDFGLSKIKGKTKLTKIGSTVGTVAYMSPEQAKGEVIDHRTDIWSLGVMLYEMLTGELPFRGDYDQAIIYSIINEKPAAFRLKDETSIEKLRQIVMNCLEKDLHKRYQNIYAFLADLSAKEINLDDKTTNYKFFKGKITLFLTISIVLLVILVLIFSQYSSKPDTYVDAEYEQITFMGNVENADLSPDGKFIVFRALEDKFQKLFIKEIGGEESIKLFEGFLNYWIDWSPTGRYILASGASLDDSVGNTFIFPRLGGNPKKFNFFETYCWSSNDSLFAGVMRERRDRRNFSRKIYLINQFNGDTSSIVMNESIQHIVNIDCSSKGDFLLVTTFNPLEIWTVSIDGKIQNKVAELKNLESCGAKWSGKGNSIYYYDYKGNVSELNRIDIDLGTGKSIGRSVKVRSLSNAYYWFGIDRSNQNIIYSHRNQFSNLYLMDLSQNKEQFKSKQLTFGTHRIQRPTISPLGIKVAYSQSMGKTSNIYIFNLVTRETKQVTFSNSNNLSPVWSPDGAQIGFVTDRFGVPQIGVVSLTGGRLQFFSDAKPLLVNNCPLSWSPNKNIAFLSPDSLDYIFYDPESNSKRSLEKIIGEKSASSYGNVCFSPDNRKLAVTLQGEKAGLWIISLIDSSKFLLHENYYEPLAWSLDGKWVYAWNRVTPEIWKLSIETSELLKYIDLPNENINHISIIPEKGIIVYNIFEVLSDIWIVKNFDPKMITN